MKIYYYLYRNTTNKNNLFQLTSWGFRDSKAVDDAKSYANKDWELVSLSKLKLSEFIRTGYIGRKVMEFDPKKTIVLD